MTLEKLSIETMNYYAPGFEVEIKGTKLAAEMSKAILNVTVEENIDSLAGFSITMTDGFDMKTQTFKWLDHPLLRENNEVIIKMGYSGNLTEMIMGRITGIESGFFSSQPPTVYRQAATGNPSQSDLPRKLPFLILS